MELAGVLSNPVVGPKLDQLAESFGSLEPKLASHRVTVTKHRRKHGEILDAIKLVLAVHPEGLQTFEARRLVEEHLGRELRPSTVKDALASNPAFERIRRGRYRPSG
jgi:hypothetical protein